jgi:hypothetical protein
VWGALRTWAGVEMWGRASGAGTKSRGWLGARPCCPCLEALDSSFMCMPLRRHPSLSQEPRGGLGAEGSGAFLGLEGPGTLRWVGPVSAAIGCSLFVSAEGPYP